MHGLLIPLGAKHGSGALTVPYLGTFMAPSMVMGFKQKDLFLAQDFHARFKGAKKIAA